jgi:hypothetical protein
LMGYDRILMTSPFGVDVVRATIGHDESERRGLDWLPHGLWLDTFTPQETTIDSGAAKSSGDGFTDNRPSQGGSLGKTGYLTRHKSVECSPDSHDEDAKDPLEEVVSRVDRYENVQAAVNDLTRLRAEGKV